MRLQLMILNPKIAYAAKCTGVVIMETNVGKGGGI